MNGPKVEAVAELARVPGRSAGIRAAVAFLLGMAPVSCSTSSSPASDAASRPSAATDAGGAAPTTPTPLTAGALSCSTDADCEMGESCASSLCLPRRCSGDPALTTAPLSKATVVLDHEDLVVGSGDGAVASFSSGSSFPAIAPAWNEPGAMVDLAGGNVTAARPGSALVALDGLAGVVVEHGPDRSILPLPSVPVALAAGDGDGDGIAEIFAGDASGALFVCGADEGSCAALGNASSAAGATLLDLATGDVDGDGRLELLALFTDASGATALSVRSLSGPSADADAGVVAPSTTLALTSAPTRLAAGDVDGDGLAEVLALEDGGYEGFVGDIVHVLSVSASGGAAAALTERATGTVRDDTVDLTAVTLDGALPTAARPRPPATIVVLSSGGRAQSFSVAADGTFALVGDVSWPSSAVPGGTRIAASDVQGQSVLATLVSGPDAVAGRTIPLAALVVPPYVRGASRGSSSATIGMSSSMGTVTTDTVSLTATVTVGFEAQVPDVAKITFGSKVGVGVAAVDQQTRSASVAARYTLDGATATAAMILATGCYQAYTYRYDDPAQLLGADGAHAAVLVPTSAQAVLWSLERYDALAGALGTFPALSSRLDAGDPSTYPAVPTRLDGSPLADSDELLVAPPTLRVSDVGTVGYDIELGSLETRTTTLSTSVAAYGSVLIGTVVLAEDTTLFASSGYATTLGSGASFVGSVPPLPADPAASYAFTPFLYRQAWTDGSDEASNGGDGYWALSFTVGQ